MQEWEVTKQELYKERSCKDSGPLPSISTRGAWRKHGKNASACWHAYRICAGAFVRFHFILIDSILAPAWRTGSSPDLLQCCLLSHIHPPSLVHLSQSMFQGQWYSIFVLFDHCGGSSNRWMSSGTWVLKGKFITCSLPLSEGNQVIFIYKQPLRPSKHSVKVIRICFTTKNQRILQYSVTPFST